MGNGPGGLKDYIDLWRSEPISQGGFVWEFNNHGILKKDDNGTEYFAYGGDFGETPNDGDFIMDGLTLSDHTPMPSMLEYAKTIQPVEVNLTTDGTQLLVTNHYDFVDLSGLDPQWHVVQDGKSTKPKKLDLPRIPAGESRKVDLPLDKGSLSHEAWIIVEFKLKENKPWAEKGHVVAWDQVHLSGPAVGAQQRRAVNSAARRAADLQVSRPKPTRLEIQSGATTFGFDLLQGNVTWTVNGAEIFQRGPELYLYRSQTQNDEASQGDGTVWDQAYVGMVHTQVRDVSWEETDSGVTVHYKNWVAPKVWEWGVEADLIYTIPADDDEEAPRLRLRTTGKFVGDNTPTVLPRIGLMAVLPREFDSVAWFGRGPGESYPDSKQACRMGEYEATVDDLFTYYDYPQENGNREDLRWVRVGNPDAGIALDARRSDDGDGEQDAPVSFSFTARRYMPHDLDAAKHPHDLKPLDMTVLHLDYANNGLGSATVGPTAFEPYKCYAEPFDFTFDFGVVAS